jgi:hypothetical protein
MRGCFSQSVFLDQLAQQWAKGDSLFLRGVGTQEDATVEIPANDENRVFGLPQRRVQGGKERSTIDEDGGTARLLDAPAIAPRLEKPRRRGAFAAGDEAG